MSPYYLAWKPPLSPCPNSIAFHLSCLKDVQEIGKLFSFVFSSMTKIQWEPLFCELTANTNLTSEEWC